MENQPTLGDTSAENLAGVAQRKMVVANAAAFALADTLAVYAVDMYLPGEVRGALDRFSEARAHASMAVAAEQAVA